MHKITGLIIIPACLLFFLLSNVQASPRQIFIVSSYDKNDIVSEPQYQGILQVLSTKILLDNLNVTTFYIDSRRAAPDEISRRVSDIHGQIKEKKAEIVITVDDRAFQEVLPIVLNQPDLYLVFTGVNKPLAEYNEEYNLWQDNTPIKNVTGVYEKLFLLEQMAFFELLLGELNKVAVLYSTDPIGKIVKNQVAIELAASKYEDKLIYFPVKDMVELNAAMDIINQTEEINAYMPLVMSLYDPAVGGRKTVTELAPLVLRKVQKPDMVPNKAATRADFLGGTGVDTFEMGKQAGKLAVKLLQGYDISRLKVENAGRYITTINRNRLNQLSLVPDNDIMPLLDEVY